MYVDTQEVSAVKKQAIPIVFDKQSGLMLRIKFYFMVRRKSPNPTFLSFPLAVERLFRQSEKCPKDTSFIIK